MSSLDGLDLSGLPDKKQDSFNGIDLQGLPDYRPPALSEAVKVNPDSQAKINKLSRDTGLPPAAVETNPDEVEQQQALRSINIKELEKNNPATSSVIRDYETASVAHDDIGVLQKIENTLIDWKNSLTRFSEGLGESIRLGFDQGNAGFLLQGVDIAPDEIRDIVPAAALPIGLQQFAPFFSQDIAENLGVSTDEEFQELKEQSKEGLIQQIRDINQRRAELMPEDLNIVEQGARSAVESLAVMAPGFFLSAATGGRAFPMLALAGSQTYVRDYAEAREAGLDEEEAVRFAATGAAIEVATELLPTRTLTDIIGGRVKGEVTKAVAKFAIREMATEQIATLGETARDLAFDMDEQLQKANSLGEVLAIQGERQLLTAISTVFAGGAQAGVASAVGVTVNKVQQLHEDRVAKGIVERETLEKINELAPESKLRGRDGESFAQFVINADDTTQVFIDSVQTRLYLRENHGKISTDPALQLLNELSTESASLGVDVAVRISEYTTVLAGTPHAKALVDFMTLTEDSVSAFRKEQEDAAAAEYVRTLIGEADEKTSQFIEAQEIFESVKSQLIDTGVVKPSAASKMAEIVPAWAATFAQRQGKSIRQVYQDAGLTIEGPESFVNTPDGEIVTPEIPAEQVKARLNRPKKEEAPERERRRDAGRRERIENMSLEERYAAIYLNELTGINNRRAFEEDIGDAEVVASIDVDSLKTVNDRLGPNAGDNLLKASASAIFNATGGKAYHISGDEFYVIGENRGEIETQLKAAQEALTKVSIESEAGKLDGVSFTFGISGDKASADSAMKKEKVARESRGERAARGELPDNLTLKQSEQDLEQAERGRYSPSETTIRLTQASDLSTFLHEFAHFMYEMEIGAGSSDTLDSIHNWFKRNAVPVAKEAGNGVNSAEVITYLDEGTTGDEVKDQAIRVATHEQFARGFETYLMEGKAPSIELRNAFRSFARWLTQIYKAVRGQLNVNLDKEMSEVFGRLLATEEQIMAAEAQSQYAPMFTDAVMAGMTEQEFTRYKKQLERTKDKQEESLRDKLIAEITRNTKTWWKEEFQELVDTQTQSLVNTKVYRTARSLRDGDVKLDRGVVKEMAGVESVSRTGRKITRVPPALNGMTVASKGVHPDEAAALNGYVSGSEMIRDLMTSPSVKDKARQNANDIMLERHGDIFNDGTIEQLADEAVRNEERGKLLLAELKALSKGTQIPNMERKALKDLAAENIGKIPFRKLHPGKYRRAEIRAAQEATAKLAAGDREGAARAKLRQTMNYYLGMEAEKAKTESLKIVDSMSRYNKKDLQNSIQKAGNGYWDQIVKILKRFEFRKSATLKQVEEINESIVLWSERLINEEGDGLILDNAVLVNEGRVTHWKNIPFSELQGVSDSVKNIEHVARHTNKIILENEKVDFQETVSRWVDSIRKNGDAKFVNNGMTLAEGRNWGRYAMAQMTKVPFLASWLDGQERVGISHQLLMEPMNKAQQEEMGLFDSALSPVVEAIEGRSSADLRRHNTKLYVPELEGTSLGPNIMGHQVLSIALNTGNQSNLEKLLLGEGWASQDNPQSISRDNPILRAVLDNHMTRSDWELVQLIWDRMDTLYPRLSEVHRGSTGQVLPKVAATAFQTPFGEFKGGYYPVKYDPGRSDRAFENEDRLNAETDSMFSTIGSIQASVNASAANVRTGYYAPIRLHLDVVGAHFQETIHYITHHEAVRQTNKLIKNPEVRKAISETLGPEEYAQLRPWINDIAKNGREAASKTFIDDIFGRLRFGVTLGVMGFNAMTGLKQFLGLSNSMGEVGAGNMYQALRTVLGDTDKMKGAWEFATENSKMMSHRVKTMDREILNAMQRLHSGKIGTRGHLAAIQELSMKHIALIQTYMVDLPTWHAAYIKEMDQSGNERKAYQYADWVVENIQGSGAVKDMATIMRSQSKTHRLFTMFMTFFSALWNQQRDLVRGATGGQYSATTVGAKLAFIMTLPVILEMILEGDFSDDTDEEEQYQKALTKLALYPVQSVPFVRDMANPIASGFDYSLSPIGGILGRGIEGTTGVVEAFVTDEEITKSEAKNASKLIGAFLGIPGTSQVWKTGEHLYQVAEEGEELTLKELVKGPNREE